MSLFWFALYLFYMMPESTEEDIAQRTRERHERARKSPGALKRDARVMSMFTCDMSGSSFCLTTLE